MNCVYCENLKEDIFCSYCMTKESLQDGGKMRPVETNVSQEKMKRLAGELLSLAAEQFSHHGCNDFDKPSYFTDAEWLQLERDYEQWNSGGRDSAHGNMGDWMLMNWLAELFEGECL